jgi:hypothetical protein
MLFLAPGVPVTFRLPFAGRHSTGRLDEMKRTILILAVAGLLAGCASNDDSQPSATSGYPEQTNPNTQSPFYPQTGPSR